VTSGQPCFASAPKLIRERLSPFQVTNWKTASFITKVATSTPAVFDRINESNRREDGPSAVTEVPTQPNVSVRRGT